MVNATTFQNKSRTINAEKVQADEVYKHTLTIIGAVTEVMPDGKSKLCICFDGIEDILVLNQTNLATMIAEKGEETEKWKGTNVRLSIIPATFAGKPTKSVMLSVKN